MTEPAPRPGKTREARAAQVAEAVEQLPAALRAAQAAPDDEALWEAVERLGATVHRQSRLLAGKSRGG
jgi:hypothetical protein